MKRQFLMQALTRGARVPEGSAAERTRTPNPLVRSQMLYPIELLPLWGQYTDCDGVWQGREIDLTA